MSGNVRYRRRTERSRAGERPRGRTGIYIVGRGWSEPVAEADRDRERVENISVRAN